MQEVVKRTECISTQVSVQYLGRHSGSFQAGIHKRTLDGGQKAVGMNEVKTDIFFCETVLRLSENDRFACFAERRAGIPRPCV